MSTHYIATCPGISLVASFIYLVFGVLVMLIECKIESEKDISFVTCARKQYASFALIGFGLALMTYPLITCLKKRRKRKERQRFVREFMLDDNNS